MPTPGYVFRDGGTTPPAAEDGSKQIGLDKRKPTALADSPLRHRRSPVKADASDSHAIATGQHDIQGAAQMAGRSHEMTDLGWRSHHKDVDNLIGAVPNEELWTLIRRFNRVRAFVFGLYKTDEDIANLPCQSTINTASRWSRYQYCRRGRVLPRQAASQY